MHAVRGTPTFVFVDESGATGRVNALATLRAGWRVADDALHQVHYRVAWVHPRVDCCYDCIPGGPFIPPPCSKCGTTTDYFSQGLCASCHPGSPQNPGSCKGCLAWGVYRRYNWTCWPCRWWNSHYPEGVCDFCGRTARIGGS